MGARISFLLLNCFCLFWMAPLGAQDPYPPSEPLAFFALGKSSLQNGKLDSAEYYFSAALKGWNRLYPTGSLSEIQTRIELGILLMRKEDAQQSRAYGESALKLLDTLHLENVQERFQAHRVIARSYYGTGQYNKAIPAYEKTIQSAIKYFGEENGEVALMMIYYSNCLNYCGFLEKATMISEKAITIQQKHAQNIPPEQIAGALMSLGSCQHSLRNFDRAITYYKKSLDIRLSINSPRSAYCYSKIGQLFLENHKLDSALLYFELENEELLKQKLENDPSYAYACRDFGLVYIELKEYKTASYWLERAMAIFQSPAPGVSSGMGLDECHLLILIGKSNAASGNFEKALLALQTCQQQLEQLYGPEYVYYYELYAELGLTYLKYYLHTSADSLLDQSRIHFQKAEIGVKTHLHNESLKGSASQLLHESLPYFEHAIFAELEYYKLHP